MAVNDKRLTVTEFDFDDVKSNLKTFLKAQTEFTDYDFEGSGMNVLLDVLAYNTHYLGYNANMLANEMFMDSASLRGSVASHAKTLGYVPTSARAAKATITVSLNVLASAQATATMSAGTAFTTTVNNTAYQFVTDTAYTKTNSGVGIVFENIPVYEGTYVSSRFTVDTSNSDQRFVIQETNADMSTLTVKVQTSSSDSTQNTYTQATDITGVSATSNVYFLQEVENGKFEIYFGDGVIGRALSDDNIIILTYVVTNKAAANDAATFTSAGAIDSITDISVRTDVKATGGAEPESIASIKYNAPLDYAAQGRCVTTEDYKVVVKGLYNDTKSLQVWGGESGSYDTSLGVVDTKEYGKVFISIKSTTGQMLTKQEKNEIVVGLATYKVAGITPVVVDPETTKLILNTTFKYDSSKTTETNSSLVTLVTNTLTTYNTDNLSQFDGIFRLSKVQRLIDETNSSLLSNITTVTIANTITPTLNSATSYTSTFNNAFYAPYSGYNKEKGGVIATTGFKIQGDTVNTMFFDDDGEGNLRMYYLVAGARVYQLINGTTTVGTVDYVKGTVKTVSLTITDIGNVDGATSTSIRITAIPSSNDIVPVRNQLLEIDFVNSVITGEVDTIAVSDASAGSTYQTTSSVTSTSSY
jgi:hypothetical protein